MGQWARKSRKSRKSAADLVVARLIGDKTAQVEDCPFQIHDTRQVGRFPYMWTCTYRLQLSGIRRSIGFSRGNRLRLAVWSVPCLGASAMLGWQAGGWSTENIQLTKIHYQASMHVCMYVEAARLYLAREQVWVINGIHKKY